LLTFPKEEASEQAPQSAACFRSDPFAQRKISKQPDARKADAEHSAPGNLKSNAVAWVWIPVGPSLPGLPRRQATTAIKRLDCAPSIPWQAAQPVLFLPVRSHPMMPRCEAVLLLPTPEYLVLALVATSRYLVDQQPTAKPDYQRLHVWATSTLWRSCASRGKSGSPLSSLERLPRPIKPTKVASSQRNIDFEVPATPGKRLGSFRP
jgi:hypothetical protein